MRLVFLVHQQASKDTSIKHWQKSLIFLWLFFTIISWSTMTRWITLMPFSGFLASAKSILYVPTWKNVVFIWMRYNLSTMRCFHKLFACRTSALKLYMIGLSPNLYKTFRYFWNLTIFISNLSRAWVK